MDFLADYLIFQPFSLTRNRLEHNIPAADPDDYPDRNALKYHLTLKVPDFAGSSNFIDLITIPQREKPPVVEGAVSRYDGANFRFDSVIDGLLERQKPAFRQSTMSVVASLTSPYCLVETTKSNDTPVTTTTRAPKWAIKAGFTESDYDQWGERFFSTHQATARQFLTWKPNHQRIARDQEEYLYFLVNFTPTPSLLKLRAQVTFVDGTTQTVTLLTLRSVQFGQIVCIPIHPYILPQGVRYYEVWLSNELNDRISEIRTYHLDYRTVAQQRSIIFNNSFHVFDTLRLTGVSTETLKATRYVADRERPLNAPADFSEFYVIETAGIREITISTGFFDRNVAANLRYLDDLLLTEECYLITDRNHEPLELLTTSLLDHDDNPDLVARTFQFRYIREQNSYSRLPVAPPMPTRPTYWKPAGLVYLLDAMGKRTGMVRPLRLVLTYVDDDTTVSPYTSKPNVPGDPNYIAEYTDPAIVVGSTPYPSALLERATTFRRTTCTGGLEGGPATIIVPASKYGGEQAGAADALAEAEYNSLNTQAYADANGTCTLLANYTATVPAGHFHYRSNAPAQVGLYRLTPTAPWPGDQGNTPELQAVSGSYIYPVGSNALNFPINAGFYARIYGPVGTNYTIKVFQNGVLKKQQASVIPAEGYDNMYLFDDVGVGGGLYSPASQDRFYIQII